MKVLVDTSVWSLALRRKAPSTDPKARLFRDILESGQPVYLLGVILQELLQGIRNPDHFQSVKTHLENFPIIDLVRGDNVYAAELESTCREKGVQAGTIDFLIAAAAIGHECTLLTTDLDFERIATVAPLKLL